MWNFVNRFYATILVIILFIGFIWHTDAMEKRAFDLMTANGLLLAEIQKNRKILDKTTERFYLHQHEEDGTICYSHTYRDSLCPDVVLQQFD